MKPVTLTTTTTEVLDFATALGIRDGIAGSHERNRTLANLLALAVEAQRLAIVQGGGGIARIGAVALAQGLDLAARHLPLTGLGARAQRAGDIRRPRNRLAAGERRAEQCGDRDGAERPGERGRRTHGTGPAVEIGEAGWRQQ